MVCRILSLRLLIIWSADPLVFSQDFSMMRKIKGDYVLMRFSVLLFPLWKVRLEETSV